jgi:hypothetical protein
MATGLRLTTTVTETVKVGTRIRQMLTERLNEHAKLHDRVAADKGTKKKPGRMKRIEDEIQELFRKEKQGKVLLGGTELDGHKMKVVIGHSSKFDKMGFMKKHGLTQADFDEFTDVVDNEPYLKITHPGAEEDE